MKSITHWFLAGFLTVPAVASASDFGLAYDYWDSRVSGTLNDNGGVVDLKHDLGAESNDHHQFSSFLQTGPGWWRPDLAASYTQIKIEGSRTLSSSGLQFGSIVVLPGSNDTVVTRANIRDADVSLRYPFAVGPLHVSAGVTIKQLKGDISVQDITTGTRSDQPVDQTFPMAHALAEWPLPFSTSIAVSGNWVHYKNDSADEAKIMVRVPIFGPLEGRIGWQRKHYHVDDHGYLLDTTLQGAMAGIQLLF